MNEHLVERFGRSRGRPRDTADPSGQALVWLLPPQLNTRIREYYDQDIPTDGRQWLSRPEVPTSAEVMDTDTNSASSSDIVEIAPNKRKGAFESRDEYLSTHYELLREDAIRPLREAVTTLRTTPTAVEDAFNGKIGIYEKVHICGVFLSTRGVAHRITFSLRRTGKKILWDQSKRLLTGSLVVLTPADDMFKAKAIVATVAARPLAALQQNPPELDLFFARTEEFEIDPAVEYVMVEARDSFYEAHRHTLSALQHMSTESFPMSEHLVKAERDVPISGHIKESPKMDLRSVLVDNKHESYENVDVVKDWPPQPATTLDASQLDALKQILTKQLSVIQGPPGTGKTHVSVQAIRVMLANRQDDDPPIIIACQTNHAVDQILRHIAQFEPEFARLGGRSKDKEVIKKRTLFEISKQTSENPPAGCLFGSAYRKMDSLKKDMTVILSPLEPNKKPLDYRALEQFNILTKAQADSLELGASKWVQSTKSGVSEAARSPFLVWLGDKLIDVPAKQQPEEFGFDFEEVDLEFEQLKDIEAENAAKDDEEMDSLSGLPVPLGDNFTCRRVPGISKKVKDAMKNQDMWAIPEAYRGAVYRHLQAEVKSVILAPFREKSKQYNAEAKKRVIGQWERNENILKNQKIIGMTTTGLSKYRALIAALQPKVVLIEEAAETLEAPVTVACMPSVQQLVLVGDHLQLRPHTQVRAHENKPYYLNISLFERLVNNKIEFTTLVKQRRMIPEVRRLLYPIYKNIIRDHDSVSDKDKRPNVRGMGGVNTFFFTHQWPESRDDQMSSFNPMEADMVVGLVEYLVCNGTDIEDITILTFYSGQRKRIMSELRQRMTLKGSRFNVVTVDSYQGEENKVVILSMVRSNDKGQIGFLDDVNRVCVALSRAQCGLYLFGNGMLVHQASKTWADVVAIMAGQKNKAEADRLRLREPMRIGDSFPAHCSNHDRKLQIKGPEDWEKYVGGCDLECGGKLECGHNCSLTCHPMSHEQVNCQRCKPAPAAPSSSNTTVVGPVGDLPSPASRLCSESKSTVSKSTTGSWKSYAKQEEQRVADVKASYVPHSQRPDSKLLSDEELVLLSSKACELSVAGTMNGGNGTMVGDGTRKRWKDIYRMRGKGDHNMSSTEKSPQELQKEEELLIAFD